MTKKQKQTVNKQVKMNSNFNKLHPMYFKGYNDGFEAGKKAAVNHFSERFDNLQRTKGFGEKTLRKIIAALDLPVIEVKE